MRHSLILPLAAIPNIDVASDRFSHELQRRPAHGRASLRPRSQRVRMLGSGYRVVIDGNPAALREPVAVGRAAARFGARPPGPAGRRRRSAGLRTTCRARPWRACGGCSSEPDSLTESGLYRVGLAFETWDVRSLRDIMRHLDADERIR